MNLIRITEENYKDFEYVLPLNPIDDNRTTIGAYDDDGTVCGAVSMVQSEDLCSIDWLFVIPKMRRQGVATELVASAVELVEHMGGFIIQSAFETEDGDDELYDFFLSDAVHNMLFDISYIYERFYISPEEIAAFRIPDKRQKQSITSVFDMPKYKQYQVLELISEYYELNNLRDWEADANRELCRAVYGKDGIDALIFFVERNDDNLQLAFLYGDNSKCLINLIYDTIEVVKKQYPEARIIFDAVTPESETLARKLFPNAKTSSVYEAER